MIEVRWSPGSIRTTCTLNRPNLQAQRFAHPFQRKLRRATQAPDTGIATNPPIDPDIPTHDGARSLLPQNGKHGTGKRAEIAEYVDVELSLRFFDRSVLNCSASAMAIPALLTTTSMRPSRRMIPATARRPTMASHTSTRSDSNWASGLTPPRRPVYPETARGEEFRRRHGRYRTRRLWSPILPAFHSCRAAWSQI